jgi:hypothetical protein
LATRCLAKVVRRSAERESGPTANI